MSYDTMNVYMASMGENCEGAGYTSLHYTLDGAVEQAKKWIAESTFEWKRVDPVGSELRSWQGGCDWIDIKERKIMK